MTQSGHPHALPVHWFQPVRSPAKLNGDQLHEHCRSQQNDPYRREPVYPLEPEGRRSELNRCKLLADYLFANRTPATSST